MIKRRSFMALVGLAALLLVALLIWRLVGPSAKGEEESAPAEVSVRLGKIARTTLHRYVTGYGSVEPEPATEGKPPAGALIASPVAGILAQIKCTEGQVVSKGTPLFRLDSRVADVALERAKKALDYAELTYERQKKLLQSDGTSQKLYQEAELQLSAAKNDLAAAQTQLALLEIVAPFSGTLVRIPIKPGEAVEATTVLAELIDLNRLVVTANIPSKEVHWLKAGQPVKFESGRIPLDKSDRGPEFKPGRLTFISSQIDLKTDTALVRSSAPADSGFRPGQFLQVRIVCEEHRDCLAVPEESLVTSASGGSAIMVVEGDKALEKEVKAGLREGGLVEVEGEGLREGMAIVTEGAYGLPNETKIKVIGS